MNLIPIIIKEVSDETGNFSHLELWQGQSHIDLSLASTELNVQYSSYKWDNLKEIIESKAVKLHNQGAKK